MKEHEHHDERSDDGQSVIARLDQPHHERRARREHERQARSQEVAAAGEEMLRRLNRGEPVELAVDPAPESAPGPYHDASDDEFDLGSIAGIVEAKKRELLPARFYQSPGDYEAQVAEMKADHWRALTTGERTPPARPAGFACVTRRVAVRSRGRRERRPGHRKRASAARAGPGGDSDSDEPDPPDAAGSLDDAWLACAGLSAADAQRAADRIAAACGGSLTPVGLRQDVEVVLPHLRGDKLTATVIAVYRRLPERLREQHDRAAHTGTEGGRR